MRRETADYLPFHTDCYTTVVRKLLPPIEKNYVQKRRDRRPRLSVCFVGFFRVVEGADPYGEEKKPKKANRGVVLLIPCRDRRPRRSVYLVVFFGSSKAPTPTGTRKIRNFAKREDPFMSFRRTKTVLLFFVFSDSRGRLSLQSHFLFSSSFFIFSSHWVTSFDPRHYGGVFGI